MRLGKRIGVFAMMTIASLTMMVSSVLASTSLTYYDISWKISSQFTPTSATNIVSIKGWQTTGDNQYPATVRYDLYQKGYLYDTLYGSTRIVGNSSQSNSSTWYYYQFKGINPNNSYELDFTDQTASLSASGAGNAYDGT